MKQTDVLHMITVHHVDEYTRPAGLGEPSNLPHRTELREERDQRQRERATAMGQKGDTRAREGGGIKVDYGFEVRTLRRNMIAGENIASFLFDPDLFEPEILYFPDEPPPHPKWKMECRRSAAAGSVFPKEPLSPDQKTKLCDAMSQSRFQIIGFWLNLSMAEGERDRPARINLVIGPLPDPERKPAPVRFDKREGGLWATWDWRLDFHALGSEIARLRDACGWTEKDVIAHGFNYAEWQRMESGEPITVTTLLRITRAFGKRPRYFIERLKRC